MKTLFVFMSPIFLGSSLKRHYHYEEKLTHLRNDTLEITTEINNETIL